jgi:hypothetical protein
MGWRPAYTRLYTLSMDEDYKLRSQAYVHTRATMALNKVIQASVYPFNGLSIHLRLCSPCGPWTLFQFLNLYTVGRTPWTEDQPVTRPLATHRTTQTQNKRTQISMSWVGIEPTIPVFERAKTVQALDARPLWSAPQWIMQPVIFFFVQSFYGSTYIRNIFFS